MNLINYDLRTLLYLTIIYLENIISKRYKF